MEGHTKGGRKLPDTSLQSAKHTSANERLLSRRQLGIWMVLCGATLWGLSGTAAQQLFQHDGFSPGWLVSVRMTVSGLVLLVVCSFQREGAGVWSIWRQRRQWLQLLLFAVLGLLGVQYTYFAAIQLGNAATATFLQYVGPALIAVYLAIRFRRLPSGLHSIAIVLALIGTFLLVTNGSIRGMVISSGAVTWGLLSAVTLAFYTLYPQKLIQTWGSAPIAGWGMLIGGVCMSIVTPPWSVSGQHWSMASFGFIAFVTLFGTLLAFYLYLASMRFISPSETSLLASAEPLSAALASTIWLHVTFGFAMVIGGLCILLAVIFLARKSS